MRIFIITALFILNSIAVFSQTFAEPTFVPFAAPEFEMIDNNGKLQKLSQFKGKVVYLEFWATWCGACRAKMKDVAKLKKKFEADTNVVFIQVNTDKEKEKWVNFLIEKPMNGVQLYSDYGLASNVRTSYDLQFLPKTFLIDKKGQVSIDPLKIYLYNTADEIKYLLEESK